MSVQWIFKYWINGEEVIQWLRHKPARLCVVKRIILQQTAGVEDVFIGMSASVSYKLGRQY
jgi:hypothetical protein